MEKKKLIVLVPAALAVLAIIGTAARLDASMMTVFTGFTGIDVGGAPARTGGNGVLKAIDNDFTTSSFTFVTNAFTTASPITVYLDFGAPQSNRVIGLRILKYSQQVDGFGASPDLENLSFQVSTTPTTTPLVSRTYTDPTSFVNGLPDATEKFNLGSGGGAGVVSQTGPQLTNEQGQGLNDGSGLGFYSVTFAPIAGATAMSFIYAPVNPDPGSGGTYSNYAVIEFQAIELLPEPASASMILAGGVLTLGRRKRTP